MNEESMKKEAIFIFESETTPTEYGNMATHFPSFYWQYAKLGTFLAISLISVIGVISNQSRRESIISFIIVELFILFFYKVRLTEMAKNSFAKS